MYCPLTDTDDSNYLLKFQQEFKDRPYFDFWSPLENYLVQNKRCFALAVNFSDGCDVKNNILEYDPMLEIILNLSADLIHHGIGHRLHDLIKFNVDRQFIVVREDCDYDVSLVGQYSTNEEAINFIKTDQLTLTSTYDGDGFYYVIINLEYTKPYFLKLGIVTEDVSDRVPEKIYYGNPDNLIKFT